MSKLENLKGPEIPIIRELKGHIKWMTMENFMPVNLSKLDSFRALAVITFRMKYHARILGYLTPKLDSLK